MQKSDLENILLAIDEEAYLILGKVDPKPKVVIVGGAAFLLRDITPRKVTHDIDVFHADDAVVDVLAGYPALNGCVAAYCDQIPYNFEDRLVSLELSTRVIDFVTPSIEDLVVMKLYAERPNDVQDVDGAVRAKRIDWNLLERLVYARDEAKASSLSEQRYRQMTEAYERMKERLRRESDV